MSELNPQPLPPQSERVRVFISKEVAYDLNKMNKITADVLKKLGCGGCHSGRTLDFISLQHFVVNSKMEVHEYTGVHGI